MDKQREAFEAWWDSTFTGVPMSVAEWRVGWQAWQAAQQPQWLPIETAPREELRDLIVFNGKVQHGAYWEERWIDSGHDWMNPQPTHWMPLPPEPQL